MSTSAASRRAVVVLAVAAVAVLVGPGGAQAHNTLASTDPVDGSTVVATPARVTLTFNEPAQSLGTEVVVTAPDGTTVSTGKPVVDGTTVSQAVGGSLPAGAYAVTWRVTSADGHPLEGVLSFTATGATATAATATGATTAGGDPAAVVSPTPVPTPVPTPTSSTAALSAAASIGSVAPAAEAEIAPFGTDQDADGDDGSLSVVVAAVVAAVVVLVVAGAVLLRRRHAHLLRSRPTRV